MSNIINVDSKISISNVDEKDGFFFVNGYLIEENQKLKFCYKTDDPNKVHILQNLPKNKKFRSTGDIFVKYKRYIYMSVNIASIHDLMGNILLS